MRTSFTSESVTEGHPDKVCDRISDAVLDEVLRQDRQGRVACETFVTVGLVVVGGEITTSAWVDLPTLVRDVLRDIGYVSPASGLTANSCAVLNAIGRQSPDIAQGVDTGGAGDQGVMFGYACQETEELMPLPIMLAHQLVRRLAEVRKSGVLPYLLPDGKSQVTVEYDNGVPVRVDSVVIAAQHDETILDRTGTRITRAAREEIIDVVARHAIPAQYLDRKTRFYVNETGKFVIGGPQSDTGMTGRKLIVDTYGGRIPHGGGAFSGKDPSKVDRSATYMARHIAKNCVAAGLCREIEVRLAYVIGRADPTDVAVNTFGTGLVSDDQLVRLIRDVFPLRPRDMIRYLGLTSPIYQPTSAYGHFGREPYVQKTDRAAKLEFFTWEKTNKAAELRRILR
ncbi:MAG: methionine adenosyltransferase [candidate division WOR-3 bacterium]